MAFNRGEILPSSAAGRDKDSPGARLILAPQHQGFWVQSAGLVHPMQHHEQKMICLLLDCLRASKRQVRVKEFRDSSMSWLLGLRLLLIGGYFALHEP